MNKVVIVFFLVVAGGFLIGIPLWGSFNPKVEGHDFSKDVNASVDDGAVALSYHNTVWTVSHSLNIDGGNGQMIPVVLDIELYFQPGEKVVCKGHLYSDGQLPPNYEAIRGVLETGWEAKWRVRGKGEFIKVESTNPFAGTELDIVSPFNIENFKVEDSQTITYNSSTFERFTFKKFS